MKTPATVRAHQIEMLRAAEPGSPAASFRALLIDRDYEEALEEEGRRELTRPVRFQVEMRAFMNGALRPVDVPNCDVTGDPTLDLSTIYHYGQNDVQPLPMCSVSVGDVIRFGAVSYVVEPFGFAVLEQVVDAAYEEALRDDEFFSLPDGPDYAQTPDQCADCGAYNTEGDPWKQETRDLDPGNGEVGPDPYIATVSICPVCVILGPAPASGRTVREALSAVIWGSR